MKGEIDEKKKKRSDQFPLPVLVQFGDVVLHGVAFAGIRVGVAQPEGFHQLGILDDDERPLVVDDPFRERVLELVVIDRRLVFRPLSLPLRFRLGSSVDIRVRQLQVSPQ